VEGIGNLNEDSKPLVGRLGSSSGVSGTGPSHNSVRMLSSETFLIITFSFRGDFESGDIVGFAGGIPRPAPRSSWKMGILEPFQMLLFCCYTGIMKGLKRWGE
jgi:hypothetical protein